MYTGIDYGLGRTNIDHETGIRYGCISANGDVLQAWADSSEADYGEPLCPRCQKSADTPDKFGESFVNGVPDDYTEEKHESAEYVCVDCKHFFGGESAFGDDPIGFYLNDSEYCAQSCLDSDILITKSPYYTYAPFCSPCVPGAGCLDETDGLPESGVKAYCFGHDWFETAEGDQHAPYVVYSVETGKIVEPE